MVLDGFNCLGIAYGGMYGMNMAAVLEAVPRQSRGAVAGFTQQGFAAGNMIASGIHLGMSKNSVTFSRRNYSPFVRQI
jgi:SHS family lactate transporter-like MFS transporter